MGTDDLFRRRKEERTTRKSRALELRNARWLIVCEGEETEVNYFESLINYANSKSNKKINHTVKGLGMNTDSLVKSVDNLIRKTETYVKDSMVSFEKIFVVFDKDSFSASNFNEAINRCHRLGYIPLWSNECFELWYILHFEYLTSGIGRQIYFDKLSRLMGKKYSKSDKNFELIGTVKKIPTAYRNATKLLERHSNDKNKSYSKMVPCTTVHKIIDELEQSLDIELK